MKQHYELLYILAGTKTDEEVQPIVERIHELMKQRGAEITRTDFWGKRKLAYEINHLRQGFYDLVEFDIETTSLPELEKILQLNEDIVRHQIVIRRVLTPEQQAAADQLHEKIAARRQAVKEKEAAVMVTDVTEAAPAPEPAKAPMSAKALDEKLEEILESDRVDV